MGLVGLSIVVIHSIEWMASGESPEMVEGPLVLLDRSWVTLLEAGLILLFVSQILKRLYGSGNDGSLLFRYGHILLYAFMLLVLWRTIGGAVLFVTQPGGTAAERVVNILPRLLHNAARLLILFGILQFLKRIRADRQETETVGATHAPSV
jgi:hypothetical protein